MNLVPRILCTPRACAWSLGSVTWILATLTASAGSLPGQVSPFAVPGEMAFFSLLDLERADLAPVKTAVAERDWAAAKQAWAVHLQTRSQPRWTWSHHDRATLLRLCQEKFGGMDEHIREADRVLARDFDLLGVRKRLERHVEWLQGPIEWTHVLSRFAYWRDLGLAYWATGRKAYAEDFVLLARDWIADNPVPSEPSTGRGPRGSVWRTLEAGIRGDAWFEAMQLFMDAPEFDAETKYLLTRSLVEHARYLHAWGTTYRGGNWQVCESSGLATIGIMLPEFKEAEDWRERGFHYLVEHMRRDVEADGAHWELTPGYHTWVMTQFLKAGLLCRANGYTVPGLLDRHEKMFEFLMNLRQPDGTFVTVGDAGFGRRNSLADNLGLGALMYQRPDFRFLGPNQCAESWLWLFGPGMFDQYARLKPQAPAFTSRLLPDAKYAVMRTGWDADARFLFFDCAPWRGGHSHRDCLQVVVCAGRQLLIDPGVYSYDQPLSVRYFRKTEAHNVLMVDGAEQPAANPELLAWQAGPEADFASGQVAGTNGLRQERSVLFVKPHYWLVVDWVFGSGEHQLARLFHFPLDSGAQAAGKGARTSYQTGANLEVLPADEAHLEMRRGWVPTGPAYAKEGPVAAFVIQSKLPAALGTVLVPFAEEKALPTVKRVSTADPELVQIQLTFPNGRQDDVLIAPAPAKLTLGERTASGRALVVRRGPSGETTIVVKGEGR
jgi:hypothetical protein